MIVRVSDRIHKGRDVDFDVDDGLRCQRSFGIVPSQLGVDIPPTNEMGAVGRFRDALSPRQL